MSRSTFRKLTNASILFYKCTYTFSDQIQLQNIIRLQNRNRQHYFFNFGRSTNSYYLNVDPALKRHSQSINVGKRILYKK